LGIPKSRPPEAARSRITALPPDEPTGGPGAAPDFTQLVAHVLGHIRLPDPGCLYDEGYVRWAGASLPREAVEPAVRDAAEIAVRWGEVPDAIDLHAFPQLHGSIEELLCTAEEPIEALGPEDVRDVGVLRLLQARDGVLVELVRGAVIRAARAYGAAFPEIVAPEIEATREAVARRVAEARALLPPLHGVAVELVHAFGSRGRGLGTRVLVGAPAPWNGMRASVPAVVALTELATQLEAAQLGGLTDDEWYLRSEFQALCRVSRLVAEGPVALREAQARWLSGRDLGPLIHRAQRLGLSPEG
jgi:hypothetical protein